MTTYSSRRATMLPATLRLRLVCYAILSPFRALIVLTGTTDDVRDIYRRAEQEELVVEGLREGDNLVGQE